VDEYPHTVAFQQAVNTRDEGGGVVKTWQDVMTIEAFVDPLTGNQLYQGMQQDNPVNLAIYYPYQDGITTDMRALWVDRDQIITIQSKPIDQGGQGEVYRLNGLLP